ncbi:transcriptional regulator [Methanocella sp. CWC-04]|uniref:Transcriptional regulator n=1 Tax=Methanooceanicella nereidis TaxID=2052831 RepID=A0AAP2RGM9_9EURY|nr:pro-sigmaK processing inhibitor BofA family protein [Methanocella sp. CWC-04]MCD1295810.1 transcriptional regulator [Methanocella sp. CWC-04]
MELELIFYLIFGIIFILILYAMFKFILKTAKDIIINAVGGLVLFVAINFIFNMGMEYDPVNLLICILGGIPGAVCLIILSLLGVTL